MGHEAPTAGGAGCCGSLAAFQRACLRAHGCMNEDFTAVKLEEETSISPIVLREIMYFLLVSCCKYKIVCCCSFVPTRLIYPSYSDVCVCIQLYLCTYVLNFRRMTMEMVESQQDDNAVDSMPDRDVVHNRSQPDKHEISSASQVSWNVESWEESIN